MGKRPSLKVEPANERILASYYERDGRFMLIAANLTDQPAAVRLQFAAPAPAPKSFADVMSGEALASDGNELSVTVPARSFRLLTN